MTTLPFPAKILESHIAILAKTGAGKSYLCQGIAEGLLAAGERVCLVDPTDRYWGLRMTPRGAKSDLDITIFGGSRGDVALQPNHGKALAEIVGRSSTSAIVSTRSLSKEGRAQFAADFFERLLACNEGILHLVIDEAHLFAPKQGLKASGFTPKMLSATNEICSSGRGVGLRIIMISQRPAKFHNDCLSCAETLIAMRMLLPHDVDAVRDWIKEWASAEQGKEVVSSLSRLPTGEAWIWAPEMEILRKFQVPRIATYDSGAPGAATKAPTLKPLDMESIQAKLAKAGEVLLAEDPRALKAEVARLRAELAKKPTEINVPASTEALDAAHGLGFLEGEAEGFKSGFREARDRFAGRLRTFLANDIDGMQPDASAPQPPSGARVALERAKAAIGSPGPRIPVRNTARPTGPGTKMPKAETRILTALAQYPEGRTKTQVAILTGYASSGGGFNNALSSLRSAGRIEGAGERLTATAQGLADLGPYDPLPHGDALLDHWRRQLGKAENAVLDALARAYPNALTKEQVAGIAGYEASGGGFNNALSRLRTLELIEGRGELRATDHLFG